MLSQIYIFETLSPRIIITFFNESCMVAIMTLYPLHRILQTQNFIVFTIKGIFFLPSVIQIGQGLTFLLVGSCLQPSRSTLRPLC